MKAYSLDILDLLLVPSKNLSNSDLKNTTWVEKKFHEVKQWKKKRSDGMKQFKQRNPVKGKRK